MDNPKPDNLWSNPMKLNELNPGHREDLTIAEIVQIASSLADNERISCNTWLTPTIRLTITLDNRPLHKVRDVVLAVRCIENYEVFFHLHDDKAKYRLLDGTWRDSTELNIRDVVKGFGLDDQRIEDPPSPGTWTGWFLFSYLGPRPDSV